MSSIPQSSTPNPLKSGKLGICVKGILSKSWQTKQCYLYPACGNHSQRIEAYNVEETNGKTAKPWKVFSLKGLRKATVKHKAGDNHLEVTTRKDKFCFASKDELEIKEWESYLRGLIGTAQEDEGHSDGKGEDRQSHEGESCAPDDDHTHLFDDNILYESADPQMQFEVSVEGNADSERLQLSGSYWLTVTDFTLSLVDKTHYKPLCIWPYKCIRRYGKTPTVFSIEVGRKSTTGPGCFSFYTSKGFEIFRLAQAKLEKLRQTEMLYQQNLGTEAHQDADPNITRSVSLDSNHKDHRNTDQERRSFPLCQQHRVVTVDNKNVSHGVEMGKDHGSAGQLNKEKRKAGKAGKKKLSKSNSKQNQEVKPGKVPKDKANLPDRGHALEHSVGEKVLPPVDPDATSRLKHVERKPVGALTERKTSPNTANAKLNLVVNPPSKSNGSTPEELYALPANKSVKARPFPKTPVTNVAERPYEEADLGSVSGALSSSHGNMVTEPDDCYDEVNPRDLPSSKPGVGLKGGSTAKAPVAPNTKAKPKLKNNKGAELSAYSKVEDRKKAWKHQGMEDERHVENYSKSKINDDGLYEPTEVPLPSHNLPPPITSKDLESTTFVDNNYDHIQVPSTKPRLMIKESDSQAYSTYSQAQVLPPAAKPRLEFQYRGHEYEEAVLSPQ